MMLLEGETLRPVASLHPHGALPRLLMLTHRFPYPLDRGDRIRSFHLLRELAKDFRITLASVSDQPPSAEARQQIAALTETCLVQRVTRWQTRRRAAGALLSGKTATEGAFFDRTLAGRLTEIHRDEPFDAILTFCTGMIGYARAVLAARRDTFPRHVLDLVDVDSLKWAAYARTARWPSRWVYAVEARRLRQLEAQPRCAVDAMTVVSEGEARAYREQHGGEGARFEKEPETHAEACSALCVVPNGVDIGYFRAMKDPKNHTMVFTGVMDYWPNVEAMLWFAAEVMPVLRQRIGDARLLIVGRNPTEAVRRLDGHDGVEVVGPVEDVREYIAQASVAIAPLRTARGVQNKVLEAMACQRAVVCSRQAAAGIDARPGLHLAVAGDAQRYVTVLERLLTRPMGRQRMAAAARERVCQRYDWAAGTKVMRRLLRGAEGMESKSQVMTVGAAA